MTTGCRLYISMTTAVTPDSGRHNDLVIDWFYPHHMALWELCVCGGGGGRVLRGGGGGVGGPVVVK